MAAAPGTGSKARWRTMALSLVRASKAATLQSAMRARPAPKPTSILRAVVTPGARGSDITFVSAESVKPAFYALAGGVSRPGIGAVLGSGLAIGAAIRASAHGAAAQCRPG